MQNIAVIIQARLGSTRLPNKMLMPFVENQSLLEVILDKFKDFNYTTFIATTSEPRDNEIVALAKKKSINYFRGSENNVLQRFIETAEENNIDVIIRVCADNPFISLDYINNLIEAYRKNPVEYISYQTSNEVPTIKTHYGFFSELVELNALKKVLKLTNDEFYLEHVTNFIYEHKDEFSMRFLPILFEENEKVRLTIDTIEDFELCQEIFVEILNKQGELTPEYLMDYLKLNDTYLTSMQKQINKFRK